MNGADDDAMDMLAESVIDEVVCGLVSERREAVDQALAHWRLRDEVSSLRTGTYAPGAIAGSSATRQQSRHFRPRSLRTSCHPPSRPVRIRRPSPTT